MMKRSLVLAAVFFMMVLAVNETTAAARVEKERTPADMVGIWIAQFSEGPMAGLRAVDLSIVAGRRGPEIALTLYRYEVGSAEPVGLEHPPVIEHRVEKGVLYFRTRDTVQLEQGRPPETVEADWDFRVVGKNAGLLGVRDPEQSAERPAGEDAPPLRPLHMKRIR